MSSRLTALVEAPGASQTADAVLAALSQDRPLSWDATGATWIARRQIVPRAVPQHGAVIVVSSLERACPAAQASGTRCVLTQSTYQFQRWLDWLDTEPDVHVVIDLTQAAPDLLRDARARRGPWSRITQLEVTPGVPLRQRPDARPIGDAGHEVPEVAALIDAFAQPEPDVRLAASAAALAGDPDNAALLLVSASAAMEAARLTVAHERLQHARTIAGDWEAVHFELGKLWLRADDTEAAADAFAHAARLMPTFAVAWSNLGAALGELDRLDDALAALAHAVRLDPHGHTVRNNLGVTLRDLGRLDEAEAAFREVVTLAPGFVFGHYNLGHALFLQGRFREARAAYEDGLGLDAARTPRQRARLALACAADGDGAHAIQHAEEAIDAASDDTRDDIVAEMQDTLAALDEVVGPTPALRALASRLADR